MSVRQFGNLPIFSTTAASVTDPSTATLVAELILSSAFASVLVPDVYEVRWIPGASTGAIWRLEHATSSGLGSSAIATQTIVFTGSNQSAEYVTTHRASPGDRFRIVALSSFTGTAAGKIQAESIT